MDKADQEAGTAGTAAKRNLFYLAAGWAAVLVSLARYPFVFGVAAVAAGVMVGKSGSGRAGIILIISSIICTGIGLVFSNVFFDYLKFALGI